jgi:hypothetical protein
VDKDMDETIIIEMAAENPPKTLKRSGRYCQKIVVLIGNRYLHSDLFLQKDVAAPSNWEDENIKSNKYNGKSHSAVRICFRYYFQQLQYEIVWVKER